MAKAELASKFSSTMSGVVLHLSNDQALFLFGLVGHVGGTGKLRELNDPIYNALENVFNSEECPDVYKNPGAKLKDNWPDEDNGESSPEW